MGGIWGGGDLTLNKKCTKYKILISLFYLMLKIHCTDFNELNGTHVEEVEGVLKYMYSSRTHILHRSVDV